jgi:hypothetical protein
LAAQVRYVNSADEHFEGQEIPESFTFQECSEQVWTDLQNPDPRADQSIVDKIKLLSQDYAQTEPMALIRYRALDTKSFPYRDSYGRLGNSTGFVAVLPLETARSFFEAAKQDPQLVHSLVDVAAERAMNPQLVNRLNSKNLYESEWQITRPPIEDWRQANDGKIPMAFREGLLQDPAQARVVEY